MILDLSGTSTSHTPANDVAASRALAKTVSDTTKCTFGKHKGQPWQSVPDGYLRWLWENGKSAEESPLSDYIAKRLRIKPKPFVSPHPRNYFAVLTDEPLHPLWEQVFGQEQTNDIPY